MYKYRWDFIEKYVVNKKVLEIGPAELVLSSDDSGKRDRWIHGKIFKIAKSLFAVEVNKEQVENMNNNGFTTVHGDAESFKIDDKFDVIVAGELIEHLSNPGLFLDNVAQHLNDNGILLLTTPNRYSIDYISYSLIKAVPMKYKKEIAKHVTCFDEDLLTSLISRHGFKVTEFDYCSWVGQESSSKTRRIVETFIRKFRPVFASTIVMAIEYNK